jgi:hypothetical protein
MDHHDMYRIETHALGTPKEEEVTQRRDSYGGGDHYGDGDGDGNTSAVTQYLHINAHTGNTAA